MMNKEEKEILMQLSDNIKVKFNDLSFLKAALIHRSYINENRAEKLENNERLEFLGDAVLELLSSNYLYSKLPNKTEGELTSLRAALVKTESLAEISKDLNLGKYLYLSKGEESTGGRERIYILANTFEAILGAIYLDSNLDSAKEFLERVLFYKLDNIIENRLDIDSKSRLQELAQELLKETPRYVLLKEEGPDHEKVFTMSVMIGNTEMGVGKGKTKQDAEQNSAGEAIKKLQKQ